MIMTDQQLKTIASDGESAREMAAILGAEPANWMEKHCVIIDKAARMVPLRLNKVQRIVATVKRRLRAQKRQVRIIILKFRQGGITTESLGDMYCDGCKKPNRRGVMLAHEKDTAREIFTKARIFQNENPEPLPEERNNRMEIAFASPHYSKLEVMTAGNPEVGRGGTIQFAHCSELAFWKKARQCLVALMSCIPDPHIAWDVTVIYESTANGVGGPFYDMWCKAHPYEKKPYISLCKGHPDSDIVGIFLPWHIEEKNRMAVPEGFVRTEEENDMASLYNLDNEQLQWRRWTLENKCGGDVDKFRQENPACDREAFLSTGRPVFDPGAIQRMMLGVQEKPLRCGKFIDANEGTQLPPEPMFIDEIDGPVEIYVEPAVGEIYGLGADTAEGLDPEETNKKTETDCNSAHCGSVKFKHVVARINDRSDPDLFGDQLAFMSWYYNDALTAPEINNTSGGSTRTTLKKWAEKRFLNMYYHEVWDQDTNRMTKKLGWLTNMVTRETMITAGKAAVRSGQYRIPSADTLDQMARWVYDKNGKATHPPGEHDDDTVSWLIMLQMLIAAAMAGVAAKDVPDYVDEEVEDDKFTADMLVGGVESDDYVDDDDEYV